MEDLFAEERTRLEGLAYIEAELRKSGYTLIAGVDEAGRGPLAGPVVAAACILPEGLFIEGINDSKELLPEVRAEIYQKLINHPDILYGVGIVEAIIIDQINILRATFEAMVAAVAKLPKKPDYVLVDGPMTPFVKIPSHGIIKGDSKALSIAAASIIAKETRDQIMVQHDATWPQYGFKGHKGYATPQHYAAIHAHGPCPIHRMTFEPLCQYNPSLKKKEHQPELF